MFFFYFFTIIIIFFLLLPCFIVLMGFVSTDPILRKRITKIENYSYANIITAYRNADIAVPLVQSLVNQSYPNHHIYLVADNADVSGWTFQHRKFTLLHPETALNLKVKSIIHATERFVELHDYIVIWDADNLAHPKFLEIMNAYASAGFEAIQGQRTAKNTDNKIAAADALGEYYKNYIERYLPPRIGSSSVISGSGMAVETELYKSYLYGEAIQKGQYLWKKMMQEDKILQNHIMSAGKCIVYAKDAICYDEKVTSADAVETQRSRWLYSYFQNLPNSIGFTLKGLFTLDWNKFLFGLITVSPPLFILVGLSAIIFLAGLFLNPFVSSAIVLADLVFVGTIFWSLYLSNAPKEVFMSLTSLPQFAFRQFKGLFKMVNPNKNFKHSEHKVLVKVEDILSER